jgi:hypothetical protein
MNARSILFALLLALCAAACGGSDPSNASKKEESSGSPGYDLPTPPADDEKKK